MPTGGIRTRTSGIMVPAYVAPATAAITNWNPSDKGPDVTLDVTNLIATFTEGIGTHEAVRSVASHATGKYFYECTITNVGATDCQVGVGNASMDINASPGYVGGSNRSTSIATDGGVRQDNGGVIATYSTFTTGDIIAVAVDITGALIWFNKNGGAWNAGGGADPATGVGGLTLTGTGPWFAAISGNGNNQILTGNFGGSAYNQTPPSGYSNW